MMHGNKRLCLAFSLVAILGAALPCFAEGRLPNFRLEKETNEKRLLESRRSEGRVTRIEQVGKELDFSKITRGKKINASELISKFKNSSLNGAKQTEFLKGMQAEHAWQRRGETEFVKLGIENAKKLRDYAEYIRKNSDIMRDLRNGRIIYGKFTDSNGKKGIMILDNPRDLKNGGTIMTNPDINRKVEQLASEASTND